MAMIRSVPLLLLTLLAAPAFAQTGDDMVPMARAMTTSSGDAFGDEEVEPIGMRALLRTRYTQTWPTTLRDAERTQTQKPDGWTLERAFVRLSAKPNNWLSGKILLDFAALRGGNLAQTVHLAYVEVEPMSRVKVTAGLFKRTYSLLELLPIAEYEFADAGLADTLIQDTGFGGRDVGAMVAVQPLPKKRMLKVLVGAYQGGHIDQDARPDGLLTARLESTPWKPLHLGADVAWRRRATDPALSTKLLDGPQSAGWAWSADAMLQFERWEVRAEVLGGDRTDIAHRALPDGSLAASQFLGAWALGTFRIPIKTTTIMPAVRLEWLDTDRDRPIGRYVMLSSAVNIDFGTRVRLLLDVTKQWVTDGTLPVGRTPSQSVDNGVLAPIYDSGYWRFVTQLQVRL
jgi:hypothetical protein